MDHQNEIYKQRFGQHYRGSENWAVNKKEENSLNSFQRKNLRRIWGPIHDNDPGATKKY